MKYKVTKAELETMQNTICKDLIAPNLKVLFCGINPGLYTVLTGHQFSKPGNRFWKALAVGLSREGYTVIATGRKLPELQELDKRLQGEYLIEQCDITNYEDCQRVAAKIIERFGRIDVLINNASSFLDKSLLDATKEEIESLIQITVTGNLFITKVCFEQMAKQKEGLVLALLPASFPGPIGEFRGKVLTPYYAAKFGETGMMEALKTEGRKFNVKAIPVFLGNVASRLDIDDPDEQMKQFHGQNIQVKVVVDAKASLVKENKEVPSVTLKAEEEKYE